MKVKNSIVVMAVLLAVPILGTDAISYLQERNWFENISVTSTNIVFKFRENCPWVIVFRNRENGWPIPNHSENFIEKNEALVLPVGSMLGLSEHGARKGAIRFTPVVYKNGLSGFRITEIRNGGQDIKQIAFVALSDTPVEVGEEDVEKILMWRLSPSGLLSNGEWKTPEEIRIISLTESVAEPPQNIGKATTTEASEPPQGIEEITPQKIEASVNLTQTPPPAIVHATDNIPVAESKRRAWWMFALPAVPGIAFICFIVKKRKYRRTP